MIAFIAGLLIGAAAGIILVALVSANRYDDWNNGRPL